MNATGWLPHRITHKRYVGDVRTDDISETVDSLLLEGIDRASIEVRDAILPGHFEVWITETGRWFTCST